MLRYLRKPLNFPPYSFMRLALSFILSSFLLFPSSTHSLFKSFHQTITRSHYFFAFDPKSLFSNLFRLLQPSCSIHLHLFQFPNSDLPINRKSSNQYSSQCLPRLLLFARFSPPLPKLQLHKLSYSLPAS